MQRGAKKYGIWSLPLLCDQSAILLIGLRDYCVPGQIGLEPTPDDFISAMLEVGEQLWRVLRDDGTLFLNLGDSYAGHNLPGWRPGNEEKNQVVSNKNGVGYFGGCKPKDLIGIPWRVALALQAAGWYLRDAIVWHKPSPMPSSQSDRCTSSYEFIFQLTKKARYYFDMEAIKELGITTEYQDDIKWPSPRNVWRIPGDGGFSGEHYATFPLELPTRCIKAGTSEKGCCADCGAPYIRITEREQLKRERPNDFLKRNGASGTGSFINQTVEGVEVRTVGWEASCKCEAGIVPCRVIEPFCGVATTLLAASQLGRDSVGIELNPDYVAMARRRIEGGLRPGTYRDETKVVDSPLFEESP